MTTLQFSIEGVSAGVLDPFEVIGTEAISSLYAYEVACDLTLDTPPDPSIVGRRATLVIEPTGGDPREIYGIIDRFTVGSPTVAGRPPLCRFHLVPLLAITKLSRQNQLFGTAGAVSVADVITSEMTGVLRQGTLAETGTATSFPYEMRLQQSYPTLDHLAQYQETNFDFISRLSERYGIFYFFENAAGREQVVFADSNVSAPFIDGETSLDWHAWSSGAGDVIPDTVQQLEARHSQVSEWVYLRDYNYRSPNVDLLVEQQVDATGTGSWTELEERFLTPSEGEFLARIRAEEMDSHKFRLHGRSMVARLAAGHVFQLRDHPFDAWNRAYLVLSVQHTARVARPGMNYGADQPMGYFNTFTVLPLDVPFRPERLTPCPKIAGLINGQIEGGSTGTDPLLDDQGRYKVRLPFDLSNSPDGQGSRWVRLATPFGGDGDGMHFPLHPGTEVVVAHVNGDPDRPVILGAVSNPATPSLVNGNDPSHNRINFRSGMGFDASTGNLAGNLGSGTTNAGDNLVSNNGNTVRVWVDDKPTGVANQNATPSPYQWLRLGAAISLTTGGTNTATVSEGSNAADGFDLATGGVGRIFAAQDVFLIRDGSTGASPTPSTAASGKNRLIGINDNTMTLAHDGIINVGEASGGAGYPQTVNINANLAVNVTVGGPVSQFITGNNMVYCGGANEVYTTGLNMSVVGGLNTTITVGGVLNMVLAFTLNILLGPVMNIVAGANVEIKSAMGFIYMQPSDTRITELETKMTTARTELNTVDTRITTAKTQISGATDTKISTVKSEITSATTLEINTAKAAVTSATDVKLTDVKAEINSATDVKVGSVGASVSDLRAETTAGFTFLGELLAI